MGVDYLVPKFQQLQVLAQQIEMDLLNWIIGGILVSGLFWTWLASVVALRGRLLTALRNE